MRSIRKDKGKGSRDKCGVGEGTGADKVKERKITIRESEKKKNDIESV